MPSVRSLADAHLPFEFEDLLQEGPVEKVVELAARGEGTSLYTTMALVQRLSSPKILGQVGHARNRIGVWTKPQPKIFFELGLVPLDRPEIIAAGLADLNRNLPLGMDGVANDHFIA